MAGEGCLCAEWEDAFTYESPQGNITQMWAVQQNLGFVLLSVSLQLQLPPVSERLRTQAPFPAAGNKILVLNWERSSRRHHHESGQLKSSHRAFNWCAGPSPTAYSKGVKACSSPHCTLRARTEPRMSTKAEIPSIFLPLGISYVHVQSNPTLSHHVPASSKTWVTCISSVVSWCWQWRWKQHWEGAWVPALSRAPWFHSLPCLWGGVACPFPKPWSVSFLRPRASLKELLLWWNLSGFIRGITQDYVSKTPLHPLASNKCQHK